MEVLVSCASRKLTPSEQKYSTGEREALACLWAIERWHTYLWGREFELVTDHKPLITLLSSFGTGHQPMRIARWSARLLNYNYTVKYKPGEENAVADALSRLPVEVTEDSCYPDAREEFGSVCNIVFDESGISKSDFSESCTSDEVYTSVANYIVKGWPVDQRHIEKNLLPYYRIREELSLHEDIIFRGDRVVVPTDLQCGLVDKAHEAHQGIVRTKQRLRQLYWFPKMDSLVQEKVKHCVICKAHDKTAITRTPPMQSVPLPSKPWQKLGIDIVGPDDSTNQDCRFAITLIDYYSKWPEVAFVRTVTTDSVIEFLLTVFSREGFPEEIVSDNGVQFTSHKFQKFLSDRNIKHTKSAVFHPQGNSEIERFNRVLGDTIQTARLENKSVK